MRNDILEREFDIRKWIKCNKTKTYICEQLNCRPSTLNKYLAYMGIIYNGNQGAKGTSKPNPKYVPLEEYLLHSNSIQSDKVRIKLLKEGYKSHQCERCKKTEWFGMPIPLELHHIDGNHYNNKISNYQLLCPNCHAQTESYRGRKNKNHHLLKQVS